MPAEVPMPELQAQLREMQTTDDVCFDKQAWLDKHEPMVKERLETLVENQDAIDKVFAQMTMERHALERKYEDLLGATLRT